MRREKRSAPLGLRWRIAFALAIGALLCLRDVVWAATDAGAPAPALVVQELSGQTFDLSAMRGKVVIINFWATWCPACRQEMPALDSFYRRYRDQGLEVIGLSTDKPRRRDAVKKAMEQYAYGVAMLADATSNGFATPAVLPETILVDRDSIIRVVFKSDETVLTEKDLSAVVLPLLEHQSATASPATPGSSAKP